MTLLKRQIKNIFVRLNALVLLDKLNYVHASLKYLANNIRYRKNNAHFVFPPDYYLYETYRLNYEQYKEDGELTAKEIIEWTSKYLQGRLKILEWGCGVARIIRHIPVYVDKDSIVYGADINTGMIEWNVNNIPNVTFQKIDYCPPTSFHDNQFNLVFALSVFTHIEVNFQAKWVAEIHRIISENGIFLFTTHGNKYNINLDEDEKKALDIQGALTIDYKQKGHRMMSTYNNYENFKMIVENYFEILEYYNGEEYPEKVGGQDLWIVRKRPLPNIIRKRV
jgi:ubiquinone/menaquinone biosynthesis C-methylase UbiE